MLTVNSSTIIRHPNPATRVFRWHEAHDYSGTIAWISPLHRHIGGQAMTDFEWLTDNKQVQRTEFGDAVEIFANFGTQVFEYEGIVIPGKSAVARWIGPSEVEVFSAE